MRRRSEVREQESRRVSQDMTLKLPHDTINEQIVIAAAMLDDAVADKLLKRFTPDVFYGRGHAAIWSALGELRRQKLTIELPTLQQIGGSSFDADYLQQLMTARPAMPQNLEHHCDALAWDRVRFETATGPLERFLEGMRDPMTDPEELRALARAIGTMLNDGVLRYLRDPNEVVRTMLVDIDRRRGGQACYPYGLEGFDCYEESHPKHGHTRMLPGMAPGQVTVMTGLSGSGKTTATAAIVLAQANAKRRVLYGAWEQGAPQTLELLALQSLGYSRTAFTEGATTQGERDAVKNEALRLSEFVRFFEVPFGREHKRKLFNDENLDLIQRYIADTGADVFVADLWRRALRQLDPDEEEQALYRQQAIAQETKCHVVLVHQQRLKDLEARDDKQPTREGIKGSSAWVDIADTIIGVHRPGLFKSVPDDRLLLLVLKQRYGEWPLAVEFDWVADHGSIRNGRSVPYRHSGSVSEIDEATKFVSTSVNTSKWSRKK